MLRATVIDWLDQHSGASTAVLTLALVGVTIYYAVQNRRMASEMKRTREQSILPKLALEFHRLGPTAMTVAIRNVGPGAAFDVDVQLRFEPMEEGGPREERRWRQNVLATGEQRDFLPPGELNDNLNRLPATYRDIRLTGSMKDGSGATHPVDERFPQLAEWREALGEARQRFFAADPERRLAEEFARALDDRFNGPTVQLRRIAAALERAASATEPSKPSEEAD